ncbi:MAG: hypothetical protein ISS57_18470 [Anaerolineales bacterium]|nr:hypothetical protein [Anaerolineales bacterium]
MFRKKPIYGVLMTVLVIIALIAAGVALYRVGFVQGYTTGLVTEGDGSALAFPGDFQRGFPPHFGHPMGFFVFGRLIGLFFFVGLLVLLIGGIRRLFWCRPWKFAGGPHPEAWKDWHHHAAAHQWGPPPWAREGKPEDKVDEPEGESEEAESE